MVATKITTTALVTSSVADKPRRKSALSIYSAVARRRRRAGSAILCHITVGDSHAIIHMASSPTNSWYPTRRLPGGTMARGNQPENSLIRRGFPQISGEFSRG